jgi:DNA-binding transcriptional ArsR family regulator
MIRTTPAVDGRHAAGLGGLFYGAVALIALAGATGAAMRWLAWPLLAALGAVAALELGGITLSAWADFRMRLGERAYAARALSAAVAVFAVVVQYAGHPNRLQAVFFAGMSALGYGVWLIQSGARRRDQLRAAGMLPAVPPAYGAGAWLRHPGLTRRARRLALADPTLGLYGSLDAARAQVRAERRHAAIATALHTKLSAAVDKTTAQIATNTFDLEAIARRLADGADYDGLAAILAADLDPARLTRQTTATEADAGRQVSESMSDTLTDIAERSEQPKPQVRRTPRKPSTGERVAAAKRRTPQATAADIARRLGVTPRTVERHLSALTATDTYRDAEPITLRHNGSPVTAEA